MNGSKSGQNAIRVLQTYTLTRSDNTALAYIISDAGWEPGTQIEVALDNSFFLLPLTEDGKFQCDTSGMFMTTCYDSLVIQNHSYQNVFQLDISNVPDTATFRIFYNADKGLLRMEQKDGRFWNVL